MLLKQIRDPEIALASRKLFEHLDEYTDPDLVDAFLAYNRIRTKIEPVPGTPSGRGATRGLGTKLKKIFLGG